MKYTVNVTEQNIKDAKMLCNSGHARARCCPVALAAKEAGMRSDLRAWSKHITYPSRPVYGQDSEVWWNPPVNIPIPAMAVTFIERFDLDCSVEPFSFELEVPDAEEGTPRP